MRPRRILAACAVPIIIVALLILLPVSIAQTREACLPGGQDGPGPAARASKIDPAHPPIVAVAHKEWEDLDCDGAFDIFEDFNYDHLFQPREDLDGDGRLTPPGGCEGALREDKDCDGRLDYINEELNRNGIFEPQLGEDLDGDGHYDDGTEDRNHDFELNDRPFPSPDDYIVECGVNPDTGDPYNPCQVVKVLPASYPYGSFRPRAHGGVASVSLTWNGTAYDLGSLDRLMRAVLLLDDASGDDRQTSLGGCKSQTRAEPR